MLDKQLLKDWKTLGPRPFLGATGFCPPVPSYVCVWLSHMGMADGGIKSTWNRTLLRHMASWLYFKGFKVKGPGCPASVLNIWVTSCNVLNPSEPQCLHL